MAVLFCVDTVAEAVSAIFSAPPVIASSFLLPDLSPYSSLLNAKSDSHVCYIDVPVLEGFSSVDEQDSNLDSLTSLLGCAAAAAQFWGSDMGSMGSETPQRSFIADEPDPKSYFLQKFRLYETRSNFYMIGRDKNRTFWKVLKISREELSDLSILEDSATYTDNECFELLKRIHEGNKSTGGLKFVSNCYGIIGIVKFLGPYYMLLITKRRKIGSICGHAIYAITKSEMIPIPNALVRSKMANSKDENRYKKLLCSVDLRKDFFFSYSYYVIRSLQKNLCDCKTGHFLYETMFVWNEYLTRGIRNTLNNTIWTVALVYGFFKQVDLSISSKNFSLTIMARRSRHYAGTRYLKRGVNEKGRVANDVEIEQIVFENTSAGRPIQISSIVQNRGSIPLFWSQETSRMNIKPDIILSKKDHSYEATRLHFENLVNRYGNPIIILNLIKTHEKKPRETILRNEFANAIRFINNGLTERSRLRFLHWDLNRHSRSKATNVLAQLGRVAAYALNLTGIFHCQMTLNSSTEGLLSRSCLKKSSSVDCALEDLSIKNEDAEGPGVRAGNSHCGDGENGNCTIGPLTFQSGVLRTNCIDCLDRTNVAQYAYGLVALARQLHALGLTESPNIDLDSTIAKDLMEMYENMGDTLALQYGGSAAHNKIFSERRGQWRPATQSQEFFRTLQRYYSNAYVDAEKQNAINVFLGYFQPQPGKPALWELDSDQHFNIGKRPLPNDENLRTMQRSLSDGNILRECESCLENLDDRRNHPFSATPQGCERGISESSPEISASRTEISDYRYTPSVWSRKLFGDAQEDQWSEIDHICDDKHGDLCNCSNFLDVDWLSSSGNSCEDELCERSIASLSSDNVGHDLKTEMTPSASESGSSMKAREQTAPELIRSDILNKYSKDFVEWVTHGGVLFR